MEATSISGAAYPVLRILDGATTQDLEMIRALLNDPEMCRFGSYLATDVLWDSDAFIAKTGFADKTTAIRNAKNRGLIYCDLPLKEAIGLRKIGDRVIVNYIPTGTPLDAKSQAHVRYMGTWQVLEWITGATTKKGEHVRKALLWFFFVADKKRLGTQV